MAAYSVQGPNASGTALKTLLTVISAATIRPKIYDLIIGDSATPADQAAEFIAGRFTAVGTAGSSFTPNPLDPNDPASLASAGISHSAEPTYTANQGLLNIRMNQRATFRWVASPGSELVLPATAANGVGVYLNAATAAAVYGATVLYTQ